MFPGSRVCDLGSGCGILSIGAVIAGAAMVYGFDLDEDAIEIARANKINILEDEDDESVGSVLEFLQTRISSTQDGSDRLEDCLTKFDSFFDVVSFIY